MTTRLCLFAHFDAQGEIKPFIVHYLRQLRETCDEVVFITVSAPPAHELSKLEGLVTEVLHKDNEGYDFAMWQLALAGRDLSAYDEVLLTNSSVFGPLWPLARSFERMASVACDVWGMTESPEIDWHLQSYFLLFRRAAHQSPWFKTFWDSVVPYRSKFQAIRSYEIGLSVFLRERGLCLVSLAPLPPPPPRTLADRWHGRHPPTGNPTCGRPADLIDAGMPLVKVELLRDNPMDVDLRPVHQQIARSGYDLGLLVYDRPRHLRATQWDP